MRIKSILILCICILSCANAAKLYKYFCVGTCDNKPSGISTSRGYVLGGGGSDVDDGFKFMINRAKGGNFLVIRTTGTDAYNPYIFAMGNLRSCATLVLTNRSSSFDPFVVQRVKEADAIYMAGGDQWDYFSYWKDTPIEDALNALAKRGPVGGTSAGQEVLGQFVNTAQFSATKNLESPKALKNPYNDLEVIGDGFLDIPYLGSVLTDAHFFERDRMGRQLSFMARLIQDVWTPNVARGITVDEGTSLLIDATGIATLSSYYQMPDGGSVHFLEAKEPPAVCQPGTPLTFNNVVVYAFTGNASNIFDLSAWKPVKPKQARKYILNVNNGNVTSSDGSIY